VAEPGDIIVLKVGITTEAAANEFAGFLREDHPGVRVVKQEDGTWSVVAGGGREQLFGFDTFDEAVSAGKTAGISQPDIWVDRFDRFHFNTPDDPKPRGLGIVETKVVGNETLYELENGTVIRQNIDLSVAKDFSTVTEATRAAMDAGIPFNRMEIFVKDNRFNFRIKEDSEIAGAQASFFTDTDPATGQLLLIDRTTGVITAASDAPQLPPGARIFKDADGRTLVQQPSGAISELSRPRGEGKVEIIGGQRFIRQPDGSLQALGNAPREAGIESQGQRDFIRGTGGELVPLTPVTMEQMINNAILAGDFEAATALSDFRDRPSPAEVLDRALEFAKSPAEAAVIASLARGEGSLVQQAFQQGREAQAAGEVRRVGPQPDFLQSAFDEFMASTEAGSLDPARDFLTSDPLTDQKLRQQEERHQLEMDALRDANRIAAALGAQKVAGATTTGTTGSGSAPASDSDAVSGGFTGNRLSEQLDRANRLGLSGPELNEFVNALAKDQTSDQIAQEVEKRINNQISELSRDLTATQFGEKLGVDIPGLSETIPSASIGGETANLSVAQISLINQIGAGGDARDIAALLGFTPTVNEPAASATVSAPPPAGLNIQQLFESQPELFAGESDFTLGNLGITGYHEGGTTHGSNLEIVGEGGEPELVDLPPGTKVTPISKLSDTEVAELKAKGVRGLEHGGVSHDTFPLGITSLLGGGGVRPNRSIFPVAGLTVPSAQAQRNLLPLEREFLMELGLQAGIPEEEFTAELRRQGPGRGGGRATFAPNVRL